METSSEEKVKQTMQPLLEYAKRHKSAPQNGHIISPDVFLVAASWGHNSILAELAQNGYDITIAGICGVTALHMAAFWGQVETCVLLLKHGAKLDGDRFLRPSPLHLSARQGHTSIVKVLLHAGADANAIVAVEDLMGFDFDGIGRAFGLEGNEDRWPSLSNTMGAAILGDQKPTYRLLYALGAQVPEWIIYYGACYPQDVQLISLGLEAKADVNWRGKDGRTPLQTALISRKGNEKQISGTSKEDDNRVAVVRELLQSGASLMGGEAVQATLLGEWKLTEEIIYHDTIGVAQRLLVPTIKPRKVDVAGESANDNFLHPLTNHGVSMLEAAIVSGCEETLKNVVTRTPVVYDAGSLCAAVLSTSPTATKLVKILLHSRPKEIAPSYLEGLAIGIAAFHKRLEVLDLLLGTFKAPTLAVFPNPLKYFPVILFLSNTVANILDEEGIPFWYTSKGCESLISPILFALRSKESLVKLQDHGYHPDCSILCHAASECTTEIIQYLACLPRLNNCDDHMEALSSAVRADREDVVRMLLDIGGYTSDKKKDLWRGRRLLESAMIWSDMNMVDLLLEAGADVNVPPDQDNHSALQKAVLCGWIGLTKRLIDLGANVNEGPSPGLRWKETRTPLQTAAEDGFLDMVQLLLSCGTQTTGRFRMRYMRAIQLAERNGHWAVGRMLKEHRGWTTSDHKIWDDRRYWADDWEQNHDYYYDSKDSGISKRVWMREMRDHETRSSRDEIEPVDTEDPSSEHEVVDESGEPDDEENPVACLPDEEALHATKRGAGPLEPALNERRTAVKSPRDTLLTDAMTSAYGSPYAKTSRGKELEIQTASEPTVDGTSYIDGVPRVSNPSFIAEGSTVNNPLFTNEVEADPALIDWEPSW